jgi:hypothetical protein
MALHGAFGVILKLALLSRTLTVREIVGGTAEGSPLPSETVRAIGTRLLAEAGTPATIIAQLMGTRRGSNKHDNALHKVTRDLRKYGSLSELARRRWFERSLAPFDGDSRTRSSAARP